MIYFISGLGADERVFKYLNLGDLEFKYIKWEIPKKHEKLEEYCKRLMVQMDLSNEVTLIGLSFGGIIAQEISKMITVKQIIIISSIKSPKEFDWKLTWIRRLNLSALAPPWFLKWLGKVTGNYYFGINTKSEADILRQIIKDTNKFFLKWSVKKIIKWDGIDSKTRLVHIHGNNDRIFPVKRIKNFICIEGGGHFMVLNKAEEISKIMKNELISW